MNKFRAVLVSAILLLIPIGVFAQQSIEGIWQGVLKVQSSELRIVFKISPTPEGKLTATLDSPDQGAKDIPVSDVAFENGNVKIEVKSIFGAYTGKLESDNATITGEWKQGAAALPLILKRTEKAPEVRRPQEPQRPFPYRDEDVVYDNQKAGIKLAGTLTLPDTGGPFPAVVLITGSGPQNRDEALLGHKPFLVLADYLTRRGIAVCVSTIAALANPPVISNKPRVQILPPTFWPVSSISKPATRSIRNKSDFLATAKAA
jgi:hypothetical protein